MTPRAAYEFAIAEHTRAPMTYAQFWACMGQAMGRAASTARTHAIAAGWPYRNADLGLVPVPRSKPGKPKPAKKCKTLTAARWAGKAWSQLARQNDPRTFNAMDLLEKAGTELQRLAAGRVA